MSLQGTACPEDLALLTKALDDRCRELGLANGDPGREQLGRRVMHLFETGTRSFDDLKRALSEKVVPDGTPAGPTEHDKIPEVRGGRRQNQTRLSRPQAALSRR